MKNKTVSFVLALTIGVGAVACTGYIETQEEADSRSREVKAFLANLPKEGEFEALSAELDANAKKSSEELEAKLEVRAKRDRELRQKKSLTAKKTTLAISPSIPAQGTQKNTSANRLKGTGKSLTESHFKPMIWASALPSSRAPLTPTPVKQNVNQFTGAGKSIASIINTRNKRKMIRAKKSGDLKKAAKYEKRVKSYEMRNGNATTETNSLGNSSSGQADSGGNDWHYGSSGNWHCHGSKKCQSGHLH